MSVPTSHSITVWRKSATNEYGESTFAAPEEIQAFWIEDQARSQDALGEEFVSMGRVLSEIRDFVALDDRMQWVDIEDADIEDSYTVKRVTYVENRNATSKVAIAYLGA